MKKFIYPPTPENKYKDVLKPSIEYRKEVIKVTVSVLFFIVVYILLVVLSIAIAALFSFLGIQLIILKPMFLTIMLGIGMIGCGLMVIFFLIKFIFSNNKVDRSRFLEIKKTEYPDLFDFIKKLSKETKTPMPKKIYLTQDVNASVFYNSSFFSMFLPVRKNLLIGMGLVNSINMSEFKAIIAHEFGHFSQHSMSLGTYVYNVNKIIYNMLFDNQGYANSLDNWASASGYFAIFANITIKIVQGIQWILQKVYIIVNKANLSLSRQMEYHADSVSAFVCGPNHLITSLYRLETADACYNQLLNLYSGWIKENLKPDNIYSQHQSLMLSFCSENNIDHENGIPIINSKYHNFNQQSRIIVNNQWASHPTNKEREIHLNSIQISNTLVQKDSPLLLFGDFEIVQKKLTEKLFSEIEFKNTPEVIDMVHFKEKYDNYIEKRTYNHLYNGYYNNRRINKFDLFQNIEDTISGYSSQLDFYITQNCAIPSKVNMLKQDLTLLDQLSSNESEIKTFDFDGKKYLKDHIPDLKKILEKELKEEEEKMNLLDQTIYRFVINKANTNDKEVLYNLYDNYFKIISEIDSGIKNYNELAETINPIYSENLAVAKTKDIIKRVKEIEKKIIGHLNELMDIIEKEEYLTIDEIKKLKTYMTQERDYFIANHGYLNTELNQLNESLNIYLGLLYEYEFRVKKRLLDKQILIG
jgi:Zn-dependent protease with chaperone function